MPTKRPFTLLLIFSFFFLFAKSAFAAPYDIATGLSWWQAEAGEYTSPFSVDSNGSYTYLYQPQSTDLASSGRVSFSFELPEPGDYIVKTIVNAPTDGSNSFFVNIDAEPQDPEMVWDIVNLTNGFQERAISWRGNGTFDSPQFISQVFSLSAGVHQLIIRGREANTQLDMIKLERTSSTLLGDTNGDCLVDRLDYVIWLNNYENPNTQGAQDGDFNSSGTVDGLDYVIWLISYGSTCSPSGNQLTAEYLLNEGSGMTAYDSSGNNLNANIQGASWTTGKHGTGLDFDGNNDYISIADHNLLDLNQYTLMAWVNQDIRGTDRQEVMEKAGAYWINIRHDTGKLRSGGFYGGCSSASNWVYLDSLSPVPLGEWTHVATTYNGSSLKIYLGGELQGTLAVTGTTCTNANPLAIGAKHVPNLSTEAFFNGAIDEVRLYPQALSQAEIIADMNGSGWGSPMSTPTPIGGIKK